MREDIANFIEDISQKDFVVFAGAGVEAETGVPPSWKTLLEAFADQVPSIDIGDLDKVKEYEYPDVAQRIFNALVKQEKKEHYYEILKSKLQTTNANYSSLQIDIIDTARHVVTTNFDDTFEYAQRRVLEWYPENESITQSLPELKAKTLSKKYSISYLHGRVDEKCLVFKKDDYCTFYPSQSNINNGCDNLERFLRYIYEEHTIVFVGFSFWDSSFLKAIQLVHNDLVRNDIIGEAEKPSYHKVLNRIKHYALLPEPEFKYKDIAPEDEHKIRTEEKEKEDAKRIMYEKLKKLLPELNITVLPYKKHKEWTEWFGQIRERQRLPKTVLGTDELII